KETPHGAHNSSFHAPPPHLERNHGIGMNQLLEFTDTLLEDQHHPHRLETSGGGSDTAAHTGKEDRHDWQERGPKSQVFRGVTSGSKECDHSEHTLDYTFLVAVDLRHNQEDNGYAGAHRHGSEIKTGF